MNLHFIIEHSVTQEKDGSFLIELFKVYLNRETRKKYMINHFEKIGQIKYSSDTLFEYDIKDHFVLRYLNNLYLKDNIVHVTPELIKELLKEAKRNTI